MGLTGGNFISYTSVVGNQIESGFFRAVTNPVELNLDNRKPFEIKADWTRPGALSKEWETQLINLARRVAGKMGLEREDYIERLPYFSPEPESFKNIDAPTFPLLIDPRVALRDLLKLEAVWRNPKLPRPDHLEIKSYFDLRSMRDWTGGDFRKPKEPYATWVIYVPDTSIEEVRHNLLEDQRGGTALDGIMFYYKNPEILNKYSLKFPGSQLGHGYAPFLSGLPNREGRPYYPSIHKGSTDTTHPKSACLIASKA